MGANGVDRVAIILVHCAHVDLILAPLSVEGPAYTSPVVEHVRAVAGPVADVVVARCAVRARVASTFVNVDITVATSGNLARRKSHVASICVVLNDFIIGAQPVCVSVNASTRVCINGNLRGCADRTRVRWKHVVPPLRK